jgi:protein-tyrosine phosphatase
MRVLFVCTGNTCRSPFAAAVARREGLDASSAGLEVLQLRASDDAVAVAREFGIDLGAHTTRRLTDDVLAGADVVVAMSERHATAIGPGARVLGGGVEDPFGRGLDAYRHTYEQIERAVRSLADELHEP